MYMSRIRLDTARRETMLALAAPQRIHGALESCYTGERQRNLWRLDWRGDECDLLVVSNEKLNLDNVAAQFGFGRGEWETRDYTPLLNRIEAGGKWRFRLCANPIKACKHGDERGKVNAHVTENYQCKWLFERAEKHGFHLEEDGFAVTQDRWLNFRKGEKRDNVRIRQVVFDGILTVTDAETFKELLCNGMGKGKAYGCGLMTVVSVRN